MTLKKYSDLYIIGGGISLNAIAEPALIDTRASIAQDVKHRLMESGLVTKLLAQRNSTLRNDVYTEMELLIETDTRLVPGSIVLYTGNESLITINAKTYEFGDINTEVAYGTSNR